MPRDPNQRAKLIVDMILGEAEPIPAPTKDPERVERGKKGGSKGGQLRAARLSPERRSEIARQDAAARRTKRYEVSFVASVGFYEAQVKPLDAVRDYVTRVMEGKVPGV